MFHIGDHSYLVCDATSYSMAFDDIRICSVDHLGKEVKLEHTVVKNIMINIQLISLHKIAKRQIFEGRILVNKVYIH